MQNVLILSLLLSFLVSCQTTKSSLNEDTQDLSIPLESEGAENFQAFSPEPKKEKSKGSSAKDVPVEKRDEVDIWIRYFTGRGRDQMKLYLERSHRYINLMRSVLKREGLPENLIYIAMIESGFSPRARSRAQAVGYWQFIESTGRRYGLRVGAFVDERMDPVLSTEAAAEYFKDLYSLFGSWHLAMAAYNAGEYRVNRAMMRHYTRDFWRLKKKRSIPRETRHYVPKFMAAHLISTNPRKYGFTDLEYQEPLSFESVAVYKPVSLKKLAEALSLPYKELKVLNPKYVSEYVPLDKNKTAILRVPKGHSQKMSDELVAASFMNRPRVSKTYVYYKVRRGDTLYGLSRRNQTTVNTLRRMNGMSRRSVLRAGKIIKIPRCFNCGVRSVKPAALASGIHIVKRGESLGRVAKKYSVTTSKLKAWNNLSGSIIHPGQSLKVRAALPATHTVKKGESLGQLARLYGKTASQLKKLNQLKSSIIHPGQVLKIKAAGAKTHTVKKGETLFSIAEKYKVPLVVLMKKNSMNFKSILAVGRVLVIP